MMKKIVLDTIKKHNLIEPHQHIVLGLSGGPDSVCLFHILNSIAKEWDLTIHPVHINHKFRPGAAEQDQKFAEELSRELGWHCESFVFDCRAIAEAEKMTGEEAGRKVRYESFARVAQNLVDSGEAQRENIRIAVAQNADDQAETILFRILRGAGTDGLSGISYERADEDGNIIVRPLLDGAKKDILTYCEAHDLRPRIDHTNKEPVYTRNKIRLELIPYLEREYNTNVKDTLIRMGKAAAADRDFLWKQAQQAFDETVIERSESEILLNGEKLAGLHPAIRQRVISGAFSEIGLTGDVGSAHFDGCEAVCASDKPSARFDMPKGYYLTRVYGDIKAAKAAEAEPLNIHIRRMSRKEYEKIKMTLNRHGVFDAEAMEEAFGKYCMIEIRAGIREPGDFITIGEGKTKKIQDYFIDAKVPKDERDRAILMKIGHEVLWAAPKNKKGRYSFKFKLSEHTKNVICIEIIC